MPGTKGPEYREPRRQWPRAEKRRLVELTQRPGASVVAVALEHAMNPNTLYRWKRLYGGAKPDARAKSSPRVVGPAASATFVPVSLVPAMRPQPVAHADAVVRSGIMQLSFASGATLRIETAVLDSAMICALVVELRR